MMMMMMMKLENINSDISLIPVLIFRDEKSEIWPHFRSVSFKSPAFKNGVA